MRKSTPAILFALFAFGYAEVYATEAHPAAAAAVSSQLRFESSDHQLEQAFNWAKLQALAYAHGGEDAVGPWYEAALPGRSSFCMRDVAHQTVGAAALGLDAANLNMLGR